jgi:hypothetical protein
MKSAETHISTSRADLVERLANVMDASRAIRSEVALSICESSEMRIASRQLRMDSSRMAERSAVRRRDLQARKAEWRWWIAHSIAHLLSSRGYSAFVAAQPRDTASVQ